MKYTVSVAADITIVGNIEVFADSKLEAEETAMDMIAEKGVDWESGNPSYNDCFVLDVTLEEDEEENEQPNFN